MVDDEIPTQFVNLNNNGDSRDGRKDSVLHLKKETHCFLIPIYFIQASSGAQRRIQEQATDILRLFHRSEPS